MIQSGQVGHRSIGILKGIKGEGQAIDLTRHSWSSYQEKNKMTMFLPPASQFGSGDTSCFLPLQVLLSSLSLWQPGRRRADQLLIQPSWLLHLFYSTVIVVLSPHVSFSNALKSFSSLTSHMLHSLPRVKRYYTTELCGDLWVHLPMQVKTSVGQRRNLGLLWTPPNTDIITVQF